MKPFTVEEKHISATVKDFETFCDYIEQRRPKLSQRMEVLGKNDVFELNAQLFFRKDVSAPKYLQESYSVIDLMFNLATLGGLYRKTGDEKANVYLENTARKLEFDGLNIFEKYCFLLETFWTKHDFIEMMRWDFNYFDQLIATFSKSFGGQELKKGYTTGRAEYDPVYSYLSILVHYLRFWGFCSFELLPVGLKKQGKYEESISKIVPNEFGVNICKILCKLKLSLWNYPYLLVMGIYVEEEYYNLTKISFVEHLKPIFPSNSLTSSVKSDTTNIQEGNYTFKAMLGKGTWRKIKLSHKHTLEDLHLSIQEAFDFDNDHLYSFFMDGKRYSRNAYHSVDGDEDPYTDDAVIGELGLYKGQKILYLFDYGDSWEFVVQLISIEENEEELQEPNITEIKGEAPPQYRFEDEFDDDSDDE